MKKRDGDEWQDVHVTYCALNVYLFMGIISLVDGIEVRVLSPLGISGRRDYQVLPFAYFCLFLSKLGSLPSMGSLLFHVYPTTGKIDSAAVMTVATSVCFQKYNLDQR